MAIPSKDHRDEPANGHWHPGDEDDDGPTAAFHSTYSVADARRAEANGTLGTPPVDYWSARWQVGRTHGLAPLKKKTMLLLMVVGCFQGAAGPLAKHEISKHNLLL